MIGIAMVLEQRIEQLFHDYPTVTSPALIFWLPQLARNCQLLRSLCEATFTSGQYKIYFPLKVAPRTEFAQIVSEQGYGLEIISSRELQLTEGCYRTGIIVSGNLKTERLLSAALHRGCDFVVCESPSEVQTVSRIAEILEIRQHVLLRLKVTSHRRLGMTLEQAIDIATHAHRYPGCAVMGLHVHPGSNVSADVAQKTCAVVRRAAEAFARANCPVHYLNFGSGLPVMRSGDDEVMVRLAAFESIARPFGAIVILEPGRPLIGNAAVLISTITEICENDLQISIDSAAYVLHGPCRSDPWVFLRRQGSPTLEPVSVTSTREGSYRICGIWPTEGDSLWINGPFNACVGDHLIFPSAGAYSLGFLQEFSFDDFAPLLISG